MEQKKQRLDDWDNQIKIAEAEGSGTADGWNNLIERIEIIFKFRE